MTDSSDDCPDDPKESEPRPRTGLAEKRTDWAEDRTALANERTFASWLRTGLTSIAIAVGLHAVFRTAEPIWLPKTVATSFIVAAIVIFWTARRNAGKAHDRLTAHKAKVQKTRTFTIQATIFTVAAVATAIVLWSL